MHTKAGFLLLSLIIIGCAPLCENQIVKEKVSPDGKYKAIAFIRDCGATTNFSPQVSLLKTNENLKNKKGNIFIGNESKFIDIYWESNNGLVVTYDCSEDEVFLREGKKFGINIRYINKDGTNENLSN